MMMMVLRSKSAAYWEGWQAVQTRQPCRYPAEQPKDRTDWARGFGDGVAAGQATKPFWRSKTMIVGVALLGFGLYVWLTGQGGGMASSGGQFMSSGFGQGISVSSLFMLFMRTITDDRVSMGIGQQYTPPPTFGN